MFNSGPGAAGELGAPAELSGAFAAGAHRSDPGARRPRARLQTESVSAPLPSGITFSYRPVLGCINADSYDQGTIFQRCSRSVPRETYERGETCEKNPYLGSRPPVIFLMGSYLSQ